MNKYDFTVGELLDKLNTVAEGLKGKNPYKEKNGLTGLIEEELKNLDFSLYNPYMVVVENSRVYIDTVQFNKIEFANFRPKYKEDKRKSNKEGNYLESVKVVLTKEIPLELELINLSQKLAYDNAKENKERLEREIAEYEKEIEERKKAVESLKEIMKTEKYE